MKGMIFAGCSFTWGQGLWYYSDLPYAYTPEIPYQYVEDEVSKSNILFKDIIRFPRLVANHFNTFEVVKKINGGGDTSDIFSVYELLNDFQYDEIDYVIFQTTQPVRSLFNFNLEDKKFYCSLWHDEPGKLFHFEQDIEKEVTNSKSEFYEWMDKNQFEFEDVLKIHNKQIFEQIKQLFINLENKGIKAKILCWTNDYINLIKEDSYFNNKFVKFEYNNQVFDNIDDLFIFDKNLLIENDPDTKFKNVKDAHPSKKCHQIIADSIIKSIEKDYE